MKNIKPYNSIYYVAIAFIFISGLLFYFYTDVANSSFYTAIATFLVGLLAIYLYIKQKEDQKRDAANIILMEIRYAEKLIDRFKTGSIATDTLITIIPTNNWYKNNYLFINDLDQDEIDELNNFYNQCQVIDKGIEQLNISKQLDQKSQAIHRTLSALAQQDISDDFTYQTKRTAYIKRISSDSYIFNPDATLNSIGKALGNIRFITTSTVGSKLKKIANQKN